MNAPDDGGINRPPSASSDDLPQQTQPLPTRAPEGTGASGSGDSSQIRIGDVLAARYRILRHLGSGGMGEVFEAEDLELHARTALKTIRPEIALQPDVLERFKREVHLARKVTHPNVCRIFDLGCHVGSSGAKNWFLTMELLAGPTLAQTIVQSGRMTAAEALPIVKQMAAGLDAAHNAGIVHRDFKSANVILLPSSTGSAPAPLAKITDFGLARASAGDETMMATLSGQGFVAGTPAYMAPEQVEGAEVSPQTDIYAFGIVMYEMLTGVLPFSGSSPWAVAIKQVKDAPVSPRVHAPTLDSRWEAAILRCMEKRPEDRFACASDVIAALEGERVSQPSKPLLKRERRMGWRAVAAGVATLLVLIGAYYAVTRFSAHHGATEPASAAAKYGWRQKAFPPDVSLSDVTVAASVPGSTQLWLFGKSLLQIWDPGQRAEPAIQIGFTIAGRADCGTGLWLLHDDHRSITNWDMDTQRALKTVVLPRPFVSASCLDKDGDTWAFLANDGQSTHLLRFDARANRIAFSLALALPFTKTSVDPGRHYLALIGLDSISVRTLDRFDEFFQASLSETMLREVVYGWSPSGRYFALGIKQLAIYDLEQKKRVNVMSTNGWIRNVGWIADDNLSVMDDRGRLYWTAHPLKTWELKQEPPSESVYYAFWIAADLRWLTIDDRGRSVLLWDYVTPSLLFDIAVSPLEIWSIAANSEGPTVAVAGKDSRIFLFDMQQQKVVRTLEGHTDGVTFVRFDPYHRLISAGDDATIRVWDPASGKLLKTVQAHRSLINAFAISPDGRWLISVSSDRTIKLWSLPDLAPAGELGKTANSGAAVAFLPNSNERFLVSDWGGGLYLYSGAAPNWKLQQQFQLNDKEIYMLCPAHDAWWAAVIRGKNPGLWQVPADDIRHASLVSDAPGYYCWTTSDGQLSATVSPNSIQLRENLTSKTDNNNLTSKIFGIYYSSTPMGAVVAIQSQPPTVLTGLDNGHLLAWPLPAK